MKRCYCAAFITTVAKTAGLGASVPLFTFCAVPAVGGPVSTLYLTSASEGRLHSVRGAAVPLKVAATSTGPGAIAVGSTLRDSGTLIQ